MFSFDITFGKTYLEMNCFSFLKVSGRLHRLLPERRRVDGAGDRAGGQHQGRLLHPHEPAGHGRDLRERGGVRGRPVQSGGRGERGGRVHGGGRRRDAARGAEGN